MQDFLVDILESYSISCIEKPISESSLNKLGKIANTLCEKFDSISYDKYRWEFIRSVLCYQFGKNVADSIMNKSVVKGRSPFLKIIRNGDQLGMVSFPRGYISLTLMGAEVLNKIGKNCVTIDESFELHGSVFAPGVIAADEDIIFVKERIRLLYDQ